MKPRTHAMFYTHGHAAYVYGQHPPGGALAHAIAAAIPDHGAAVFEIPAIEDQLRWRLPIEAGGHQSTLRLGLIETLPDQWLLVVDPPRGVGSLFQRRDAMRGLVKAVRAVHDALPMVPGVRLVRWYHEHEWLEDSDRGGAHYPIDETQPI